LAKAYLIEGPVGAGKSTFSKNLSQRINAPHLDLDSWMVRLFSPDRPASGTIEWYVERKERCIEQIWYIANEIMDSNCDVILELGLIQRLARQAMYRRIEDSGHQLFIYVLDAPREVRRERVRRRNFEKGDTFSMVVPDEIIEMASDMWEKPDDIECSEHEIEIISE
jgi:predicted kinase